MKLAMFGGTFDPIHLSHLALCKACKEALQLDRVILMPTFQPPHKTKSSSTSTYHRLNMCRLEAETYPWLTVSDMEIRRGGASFTVDTLTELKREHPNDELYLLTGADMFLTIQTWFQYSEFLKLATLCTVPRGDTPIEKLREHAKELQKDGAKTAVIDAVLPPISSTQIRLSLTDNTEDWKTMVSEPVADYILRNGLYTEPDTTLSLDEQYTEIIKKRLTPYRFTHSLAVAKEAKRLAEKYGGDPKKSYTAGLLHDIIKDTPPSEQLHIAETFDVDLDEVEKNSPKLWHARLGSVFLEYILGISDRDILHAVRYHTTARAGMSLLEKIIYIADFTSEDRDYDDVDVMRRKADVSLQDAMQYALQYTIDDLTERGSVVHPDTLAAYREVFGFDWKGRKSHD